MDKDSRALSDNLYTWSVAIRVIGAIAFSTVAWGTAWDEWKGQPISNLEIAAWLGGSLIFIVGLQIRAQSEIIYLLNEK